MDWIGKSWMVKGILSFVGFVAVLAVTQSLLAAILAMALVSWLVIFSMIFHGQRSWIP